MNYKKYIINIKDYPIPGILFRDLTPLLGDGKAFSHAIKDLAGFAKELNVTKIISPEARGFLVGTPLATSLKLGFVPIRKPNKLPREVYSYDYTLEYGSNTLEMHKDALNSDDVVLVVDDLLATGGTIKACIELAKKAGAKVVGAAFLMELSSLKGRELFPELPIKSLVTY